MNRRCFFYLASLDPARRLSIVNSSANSGQSYKNESDDPTPHQLACQPICRKHGMIAKARVYRENEPSKASTLQQSIPNQVIANRRSSSRHLVGSAFKIDQYVNFNQDQHSGGQPPPRLSDDNNIRDMPFGLPFLLFKSSGTGALS